jgi:diguanylate cyclase (GGDEF)-like protein/PAS domain S-box-containing protein
MTNTPLAKIILWTSIIILVATFTLQHQFTTQFSLVLLDNLHWTTATAAAAALAWLGYTRSSGSEQTARRWFSVGLTAYFIGQVLFDIQVYIGWNPFPAPSDLFYLMLGPGCLLGMVSAMRIQLPKSNRGVTLLDTAILSIAVMALILTIYLPRSDALDLLSLSVMTAYPLFLLTAACFGILLILHVRPRLEWPWMLFQFGLCLQGLIWMWWNSQALSGTTEDASFLNELFSVASIIIGGSAMKWRMVASDSKRYEKFSEGVLRMLPLLAVLIAALAAALVLTSNTILSPLREILLFAAIAVILFAALRQSMMLNENEQLLEAEKAVTESRRFLQEVIDAIPVGIFWKDRDLRFVGGNAVAAKDAGFVRSSDLAGKTDYDLIWKEFADEYRADDRSVMDTGVSKLDYDEQVTTTDGRTLWVRTSKVPLQNDKNENIGILGVYRDITAQKDAEAEIHSLAFYDSLTGLPNRRMLLERIRHFITSSIRHDNYGAILFLDLDNFKNLNDTRGHDIGDLLLIEVANQLQGCVRDGDTVARLGGDEFIIMLEGLSADIQQAAAQAEGVAQKILESIRRPIILQGFEHHGSISIGIILFRGQELSEEELLKYADTAMYEAKGAGRNTLRFFDPVMQSKLESRMALDADLRQGLKERQFKLYYHIQVNHDLQPIGAEVLLRWQHPQRGLIMPLEFIRLAEETGLILPIGQWVLETACECLEAWEGDPLTSALDLSVNVSARQFRQPDFVEQVRGTLARIGNDPRMLKLELTESMVLENVQDTSRKMRALKELGVRFSMDDFGTGYSSLAYLTQLPFDQLKIDQSFVRNIGVKSTDEIIVQTIIGMGRNLGMQVMAEGVETEEQRAFLEQHDCNAYQGFLFGKPVHLAEFEQRLGQSPEQPQ